MMLAASQAPNYLAAFIAGIAVVVGLYNAIMGARYSRRADVLRWNREVLVPTYQKFLQASLIHHGMVLVRGIDQAETFEHKKARSDALTSIGRTNQHLQMVSGRAVRDLAKEIDKKHHEMDKAPLDASARPFFTQLDDLRSRFIAATRSSLDIKD